MRVLSIGRNDTYARSPVLDSRGTAAVLSNSLGALNLRISMHLRGLSTYVRGPLSIAESYACTTTCALHRETKSSGADAFDDGLVNRNRTHGQFAKASKLLSAIYLYKRTHGFCLGFVNMKLCMDIASVGGIRAGVPRDAHGLVWSHVRGSESGSGFSCVSRRPPVPFCSGPSSIVVHQ